MERNIRVLPPEVLMEDYQKLLQEEGSVLPLVVTGSSMVPFLVGKRDSVYLSRFSGKAKKGDILLYKRDNGNYILHRVYKIEGKNLVMLGDSQQEPEFGIRPEQVIAIAVFAKRKGKIEKPGTFLWDFFEKIWIRTVPFRKIMIGGYSAVKRFFKH